jgi:hypothetical protein
MSFLLLEDGSALLLESGFHLLLDRANPICPSLLLEDGSYLLLENGDRMFLEGDCGCIPYPPIGPALLLQSGFYLLLEDCSHLLLEDGVPPSQQARGYANQRNRLARINEAMEEEDLLLILSLWMELR